MANAIVQKYGDNCPAGINPVDFDADYPFTVDWYGVPENHCADVFDCAHDAVLDGTAASDLRPFVTRTNDLDVFKAWIGLPDAYVRSGKSIAPRDITCAYDETFADSSAALNDYEFRGLMLAAGCYLFGDSADVAQYRRAIELRLAPFEIAVYAARRLIFRSGGSLTITGPPAVLISHRIELQSGSTITTQTVSRILSDHLIKVEV